MTIETFETAGTLNNPQSPTWSAVIRDADGRVLHSCGRQDSEQAAVDDVTRQYAAADHKPAPGTPQEGH